MLRLKKYFGVFIVVFSSFLLILPFFQPGFFPMHDDTQVARIFEMSNAILDGQFPVRWVENLGYGYGYPVFNYYAPFAYYVGSAIHLIGFDVLLATKITFILAIVLSGIFMYLFVRDQLSEEAGVVAGVVYLFFPYHAVNTYVRGALAELWAYAFLPLLFWGIWRIYRNTNDEKATKFERSNIFHMICNKWLLLTTLSMASIIISHNLSAYMVMLFGGILIVILFFFTRNKSLFSLSILSASAIAMILSAFYIVPVIFETHYSNVTSQVGGTAHFSDHFVCPIQLWESPWGYGGTTITCTDGLSYKLGKTNILFVVASIVVSIFVLWKKRSEKFLFFLCTLLFFVLSLFLLLPISGSVWQLLPGMVYIQYPWRFLNFTGLAMSMLVGVGIYSLGHLYSKKIVLAISIGIILITSYYNAKLFEPKIIVENDVTFYTDSRNIRFDVSKRSDEYLPKNFERPKRLEEVPSESVVIGKGLGSIKIQQQTSQVIDSLVQFRTDGVVHFNIAYFPAWTIYVDGKKTSISQTIKGFDVPIVSGSHRIVAQFEDTLPQRIGNILSLVGVLSLLAAIILSKRTKMHG